MFREILAAILSSQDGLKVVGQSATGEEAAALAQKTKPDVVLTELDMQLKTAEEILGAIRSASPSSKIVVLTLFDNLRYVRAVSRMGVDAYLHKTSSAEELVATIDALSRHPAGDNTVVTMPRGLLRRLGEEPWSGISERETEVLVLAARGLSNRRIAGELHLSEATVKRHMANIFKRVGVNSRTEAVRMALMEQWIGLGEITSSNGNGSSGG